MKQQIKCLFFFSLLLFSFSCSDIIPEVVGGGGDNNNNNASKEYLTIQGGKIMRKGKPYYGVGVNYFDPFSLIIQSSNNPQQAMQRYKDNFKKLKEHNIPFIRFTVSGWGAADSELYRKNKELYFALLDEFVKEAQNNGIGLIPCLFWNQYDVPDITHEHLNQWGNPNSKTIQYMRQYTKDIVSRYKDSSAIWAWEFANEYDLSTESKRLPGTRATVDGILVKNTDEDYFRTKYLEYALGEFVKEIRTLDKDRAIFSGNVGSTVGAYKRYEDFKNKEITSKTEFPKELRPDTYEQYTSILRRQNRSDMTNTVTIHLYPHNVYAFVSDIEGDGGYKGQAPSQAKLTFSYSQILKLAKGDGTYPVFLGEFGVRNYEVNDPEYNSATGIPRNPSIVKPEFQAMTDAILENEIQLSALWVFDFDWQSVNDKAKGKEYFNVSFTNERKYQLDRVKEMNTTFQNKMK